MLSYQHIYHAGSFADVHKHLILSLLIDHLKQKDKAFCVIDCHGGRGLYDLTLAEAQKTAEYKNGIEKIWQGDFGVLAKPYLDSVRSLNTNRLVKYPGSPLLAKMLMRPDDALIVTEKHPQEFDHLKSTLNGMDNVAVHFRDAYEGLMALIPPAQKRGLVVIDPSYEDKAEYPSVAKKINAAIQKWPQGIYMIWYPLLPQGYHLDLTDYINALISELTVRTPSTGMHGSGVAIVNAPYMIGDKITHVMNAVMGTLSSTATHRTVNPKT